MTKCDLCGKDIKFVRNKKEGVNIPVNPTAVYFVPPNGFQRVERFINTMGNEVKGCRAADGMIGYKKHDC